MYLQCGIKSPVQPRPFVHGIGSHSPSPRPESFHQAHKNEIHLEFRGREKWQSAIGGYTYELDIVDMDIGSLDILRPGPKDTLESVCRSLVCRSHMCNVAGICLVDLGRTESDNNPDILRSGMVDSISRGCMLLCEVLEVRSANITLCDRTNNSRQRNLLDLGNGILPYRRFSPLVVDIHCDPLSHIRRCGKCNRCDHIRTVGIHRWRPVDTIAQQHIPRRHLQVSAP